MIVRSFLKWFENAPVAERIEAARAMTQAYVADHLGSDSREDAEAALTLILDDPSPQVRRALAWELANCEAAPRHVVVSLAHDQPEVAALVLARSPLLREADLVDCAAAGTVLTQTAIAMRIEVPVSVSAALAEIAEPQALIALLHNPGAEIAEASFRRMAERHCGDAALREALNQRDDLPVTVRQMILTSLSGDLLRFAGTWLSPQRAERVISETRDAATIDLAQGADDLGGLVDHLRSSGRLTPGLLLRGLLCGETALFGAALTALTGLSARRIAGMLEARGQGALSAACLRAGLPRTYLPAFLAAVAAARDLRHAPDASPRLNRAIIQKTLAACLDQDESEVRGLLAMLRRFDAEAAREDARAVTAQIMLTHAPVTLDAPAVHFEPDLAAIAADLDLVAERAPDEPALHSVDTVPVDLDRLAHDLAIEMEAPLPSAFAAEMDALFSDAFAVPGAPDHPAAPEGRDAIRQRLLEPLRVIETPAQQLDESYFNSWELRKSAA